MPPLSEVEQNVLDAIKESDFNIVFLDEIIESTPRATVEGRLKALSSLAQKKLIRRALPNSKESAYRIPNPGDPFDKD